MKLAMAIEVPGKGLFFVARRVPHVARAEIALAHGEAHLRWVMVPPIGWSAERMVDWLKGKFADKAHCRHFHLV